MNGFYTSNNPGNITKVCWMKICRPFLEFQTKVSLTDTSFKITQTLIDYFVYVT